MKATLLSWTAKYGVAKTIRRTLGYHADSNDKAVETYSRDAMAGPLLKYEKLLFLMRGGSYDPDCTRSGRWSCRGAELGLSVDEFVRLRGLCGLVAPSGAA